MGWKFESASACAGRLWGDWRCGGKGIVDWELHWGMGKELKARRYAERLCGGPGSGLPPLALRREEEGKEVGKHAGMCGETVLEARPNQKDRENIMIEQK